MVHIYSLNKYAAYDSRGSHAVSDVKNYLHEWFVGRGASLLPWTNSEFKTIDEKCFLFTTLYMHLLYSFYLDTYFCTDILNFCLQCVMQRHCLTTSTSTSTKNEYRDDEWRHIFRRVGLSRKITMKTTSILIVLTSTTDTHCVRSVEKFVAYHRWILLCHDDCGSRILQ